MKIMNKKLERLKRFVRDFEKAEEEKDKVKFIKNYFNNAMEEVKLRKNDDEEIDELDKKGIKLTQKIIEDEDKIKKDLISPFENMAKNCKEKFIPNLKNKLDVLSQFDVSYMDVGGLNESFVLDEKLVSREDIVNVAERFYLNYRFIY